MSGFLSVTYYEARMGLRRWGVWLAIMVVGLQYVLSYGPTNLLRAAPGVTVWQAAGTAAYLFNVLLPVVGGIAMADRLARDAQLRTRELVFSTPLPRLSYVLGKYAGTVIGVLIPVFLLWLAAAALFVRGGTPQEFFVPALAAFAAIIAPAYLFVGAFSIACTAVLPVRVYQILFTGYWVWGNFVMPDFVPTLNGTLLTPSGVFAAGGFFQTSFQMGQPQYTTIEAVLNLLVLAACAGLALLALERYLAWQTARE